MGADIASNKLSLQSKPLNQFRIFWTWTKMSQVNPIHRDLVRTDPSLHQVPLEGMGD